MGAEEMADLDTMTLGMGCFWSPEALFGALPGVIATRVGYAGGTTPGVPTYRELGDHAETVEVTFDPARIACDELLNTFWNNHNPININGYKGTQYQSLLLYRDERQAEAFERAKEMVAAVKGDVPETRIAPLSAFYPAESRHQKYYLKRHPDALAKLGELYPTEEALTSSTAAARLNGVAKGYANLSPILAEIASWPLEPAARDTLIETIRRIRW